MSTVNKVKKKVYSNHLQFKKDFFHVWVHFMNVDDPAPLTPSNINKWIKYNYYQYNTIINTPRIKINDLIILLIKLYPICKYMDTNRIVSDEVQKKELSFDKGIFFLFNLRIC